MAIAQNGPHHYGSSDDCPIFLQSKSLVVCHAQASFTRPMTNHLTETACVFPKVVIDFDF
jgi:hypothetical protein